MKFSLKKFVLKEEKSLQLTLIEKGGNKENDGVASLESASIHLDMSKYLVILISIQEFVLQIEEI